MISFTPTLDLSHVPILIQFTSQPDLLTKNIPEVYALFYGCITKAIKSQHPGILTVKSSGILRKDVLWYSISRFTTYLRAVTVM